MTRPEARTRARETGAVMAAHGVVAKRIADWAHAWDPRWDDVVEVLGRETAERCLSRGHSQAWRKS